MLYEIPENHMNAEHHTGNDAKAVVSGLASGIIEKIWDFNWCLKAIYVGLFADISLIVLTGHDLASSSFETETLLANAGKILCASLVFMCFVSLVVPAIVHVLNALAQPIPQHHPLPPDCVRPDDLKRLALEEKSDFLLKLCVQHSLDVREGQVKKTDARTLLTGLTILVAGDYILGYFHDTPSIMRLLQSHLTWGVVLVSLLALGYGIVWTYEQEVKDRWIWYPPLAEQKRQAQKETEDRQHDARRKYQELQRALHQSDD